ncbi:MAG: hypothetical protein WCG99_00635 [Candidatus Berkelbacteria bacterium]
MCQICTVAIIGGLGFSRWLHVDDTVSGVWIGALLVTIIYYSISWLAKYKIKFWGRDFVVSLAYYALVFIPLYTGKIIGHPLNQIWGIDKFVVGAFSGSIFFIAATILYSWLKKKNGNHAHFPMEKVVIPIISLIIVSAGFYFLTK